jgi:hypothetical protein
MIRPIDIRLNAAHPELPLLEAVTFTGSPSTVLVRGVPPNCGRWAITAVFVAATFPDGSTTTRAAVQSANGVWVATLPATARSGRTANGLRVLADGIDENGEAVTGYILGVADFAVASLDVTPAPEPGETSWQMLYFDAVPSTLRKGDVAKVDGVLKLYNGTAWEAFAGDIPAPSTATPAMDGTGAAGSSAAYARGDHVHPTDTSRMAASATGANILSGRSGVPPAETIAEAFSSVGYDLGAIGSALSEHTSDTTIHVTSTEKATWNGKQNALSAQQLANIAAVPNKANDADVLHNTGGWLVLSANVVGMQDPTGKEASFRYVQGIGTFLMLNDRSYYVPSSSGTLALTADLRYSLTTKTIDNGAVTLDDRAINAVAVSSSLASLTVNFPTATSGKARDFGLRLTVASGITTAPQIVLPQGVVCENSDGEAPEIGADGAATILYFTETASGVFLVKGEVLQTITQA